MSQALQDRQVVSLQVVAPSAEWLGSYTHLEAWRSLSGPEGPYEELTGDDYDPAFVPPGAAPPPLTLVTGPWRELDGKTLKACVAGRHEVEVTFSSVGPMLLSSAASQVVLQGQGAIAAYVDEDGAFVLTSLAQGVAALVEVTGGTALADLGLSSLSPENLGQGRSPWIPLQTETSGYTFTDPWGTSSAYYKTRYRNDVTGAASEFSAPIPASPPEALDVSFMAQGFVAVVDIAGRPLVDYAVQVYAGFNGTVVDGRVIAAGDLVRKTDERGRATFSLVRGQEVTVALPGTNLRRTLTVPTDPSVVSFNLLDGALGPEDVFTVAVPDIVVAERRSL